MDSQYDPEAHEPKIRKSPSSKLSACSAANSLSRFHGSCSKVTQKPLIIHTFDPEIIVTEPGEFMWVVQRFTGSPDTRRSLRGSKRKWGEMQSQAQENFPPRMKQNNESSVKEVTARACTTAIAAGDFSAHFCIKDHPSSPLSPNSSDICNNCIDNPLVLPLSSDTLQLNNCKVSHPSPASSSNSADSKENSFHFPSSPISPTLCNNTKQPPQFFIPIINPSALKNNLPLIINPSYTLTNHNPSPLSNLNPDSFTTNNDPASPLSPNVSCSNSGNTSTLGGAIPSIPVSFSLATILPPEADIYNRDRAPWSPLSPTSGLTSSSEDCNTDPSTECCTTSARDQPLPNNNMQAAADDQDESNFFVFSLDSYYGNNTAQDALEFNHSNNFLGDSTYSSMTVTPCTEAFNLSCLKDLATNWLPIMD